MSACERRGYGLCVLPSVQHMCVCVRARIITIVVTHYYCSFIQWEGKKPVKLILPEPAFFSPELTRYGAVTILHH